MRCGSCVMPVLRMSETSTLSTSLSRIAAPTKCLRALITLRMLKRLTENRYYGPPPQFHAGNRISERTPHRAP